MSYYLRGPIDNFFYILGVDSENSTYILGNPAGTTGSFGFYYFDSNYSTIKPSLFQKIKSSTAGINFQTGLTQLLQLSDGSMTLTPINSTAIGFEINSIDTFLTDKILAGVFYNMTNFDGRTVIFHIISQGQQIPAITKIRFVPMNIFLDKVCTSNSNVLQQELLWLQGSNVTQSFTTQSQCQNGFVYRYCNPSEQCGECFGPCGSQRPTGSKGGSNFCTLGDDHFTCTDRSTAQSSRWGTLNSVLFISLMTMFVILMLIFIYIVYRNQST